MTQLTVTIPDSIYHNVQTLSDKDGWLIDNFIALALGEKMAAFIALSISPLAYADLTTGF